MSPRRLSFFALGFGLLVSSALLLRPTKALAAWTEDKAFFSNIRVTASNASSFTLSWTTATATNCNSQLHIGSALNQLNYVENEIGYCPIVTDASGVKTRPPTQTHSVTMQINSDLAAIRHCGSWPDATKCPDGEFLNFTAKNYLLEILDSTSSKKSGTKLFYSGKAVISDISVSDIAADAATLNFKTNDRMCATIKYGVDSALAAASTKTFVECNPDDADFDVLTTPLSDHHIFMTGLSGNTKYYYEIKVFDYDNTTATGNFMTAKTTLLPSLPVTITAVNIGSVSDTGATISFSYSSAAPAGTLYWKVNYGPTTKYTNSGSSDGDGVTTKLATSTGNQPYTINGLDPSKTYHFNVEIDDANGTNIVSSADRSFSTPNTNGPTTLTIDKIRVDCVDKVCDVSFSTNKLATVAMEWSTGSFDWGAAGVSTVTESAAKIDARSFRIPAAAPFLTANTRYHYRLRASVTGGEFMTTGDVTFVTSANATDHLFSTGSCSIGGATVDIGSCSGTTYCYSAGLSGEDCTKCGATCSVGQTCRPGMPASCMADPSLTKSPSQCNNTSCFSSNGVFKNPAPAGCYSSFPRCNANTVLQVQRDRGCNLWLSCTTSVASKTAGQTQNLCLDLGTCNSLSSNGQCNHYLDPGQCSNDPLRFCNLDRDCQSGGTCNNPDPDLPTKALKDVTFQTPADISKIANLSGNILAGLDWGQQGGLNVIQGSLPWQLMRQVGGDGKINDGDMERNPPQIPEGWQTVPTLQPKSLTVVFEDANTSPNHVLNVSPDVANTATTGVCSNNNAIACTVANQATVCGASPIFCDVPGTVDFAGVATNSFDASPTEYYYAEARIRGVSSAPIVRMQFGYNDYSKFEIPATQGTCKDDSTKTCTVDTEEAICGAVDTCVIPKTTIPTSVDVRLTSAWQRVTLGPLIGLQGATQLGFVCVNSADCGQFQVDDVIVKPVLQSSTNPTFITPSCRLYPKDDSPSCDYVDSTGTSYKGWVGYCLERDSQTGTCISWWPVDIVQGESDIFGSEASAGYKDRIPLFMCAESSGTPYLPQVGLPSTKIDGNWYPMSVGSTFQDPFCDGTHQGAAEPNPLFPGTNPRLCGVARGPYLPMTTVMNGDEYDRWGAAQCDDIENIARCKNYSQPGFCFCTSSDAIYAHGADGVAGVGGTGWKTPSLQDQQVHENDIVNFTVHMLRFNYNDPGNNGDSDGNLYSWDYLVGNESGIHPADGRRDLVLTKANNWTDQQYNTTRQASETVQLHWSAVDGHLDGIYFRAQNQNSDWTKKRSGFFAVGLFMMKDQCTKLVQVVRADGTNAAFSARVTSPSYTVPDLVYGLSSNFTPFGGAVSPLGSSIQPSDTWGTLVAELADNVHQTTTSGQARSGSPYACDGGCGLMVCSNNPALDCASKQSIIDCQTDNGICMGVPSKAGSNKQSQIFAPGECVKRLPTDATGKCSVGSSTCGATTEEICLTTSPVDSGASETKPSYLLDMARAKAVAKCGLSGGIATSPGNLVAGQPNYADPQFAIPPEPLQALSTTTPYSYTMGQDLTEPNGTLGACDGDTLGTSRCVGTQNFYTTYTETSLTRQAITLDAGSTDLGGVWRDGADYINLSALSAISPNVLWNHRTCTGSGLFGVSCTGSIYVLNYVSTGVCSVEGPKASYLQSHTSTGAGVTCTTSDDCQRSLLTNNAFYGEDHIKQLFAQSYGVWTNLRCVTHDGKSSDVICLNDKDCNTSDSRAALGTPVGKNAFCSGHAAYVPVPKSKSSDSPSTFVGWNPPTALCAVNPAKDGQICGSSKQACIKTIDVTGTGTTMDDSVKNALAQCGLTTGTAAPTYDALGLTVTNATPIMTGSVPKVPACNGVSTTCPGSATGIVPYDAGTQAAYTAFSLTTKTCTTSCPGRCSSTQQYVVAGMTLAKNTAAYVRPGPAVNSIADYCGIPPTVFNAGFVGSGSNTVIIQNGSGSVSMKFNMSADKEQLPLKTINIDWGDNSIKTYPFPYAPRDDPSQPMIFSHVYALNKSDLKHCSGFGSSVTCSFPIRIQVIDNWNWSSWRSDIQPHTPPSPLPEDWFDPNLKVTVQP